MHLYYERFSGANRQVKIRKLLNPRSLALAMPALNAKPHNPHIRAYFQYIVYNGKQLLCGLIK